MTSPVDAITSLNITGNVIPNTWWSRITMPNGKPDCNAVVILSEIVYWYRARIVRDESTGRVLRAEKRFKADKLQRTYQSFADQFGFTKRQVQEAMYRLRDAGLITLELRTLYVDGGVTVSNVLFIEPVAEKIEAITTISDEVQACESGYTTNNPEVEVSRYNVQPSHVSACTPITLERETNTEITTETTTETKSTDGDNAIPQHEARSDTAEQKTCTVDCQAAVDEYNRLLPDMPAVREVTDQRKTKLRNFWKKFCFTQERWSAYLEYIATNCRWMSERRARRDGESSWKPKNFDFLITEKCYLGVLEGRFDD